MLTHLIAAAAAVVVSGTGGEPPKQDAGTLGSAPASESTTADPAYALGFTVNDIDGKPVDLASFKGKVVLIVNVASRCGFTKQYASLQALYESRKDQGFVVLGFPANNFMGQEPGSDAEIKQFCTSKYNVTFPMFSKISVKGADQHPLYKLLASQPKPVGEEPGWNFTKYLLDRDGRAVARFGPSTDPMSEQVTKRVDELLSAGG